MAFELNSWICVIKIRIKFKIFTLFLLTVVYPDQSLNAAHSKCWSKSYFSLFSARFCKILIQKLRKMYQKSIFLPYSKTLVYTKMLVWQTSVFLLTSVFGIKQNMLFSHNFSSFGVGSTHTLVKIYNTQLRMKYHKRT